MGLDSIDADLKRPDDVMNPFDFHEQRTTASGTSEVPRVQNILKSYNTNQDYKMAMNCLAWKQQTLAIQFLW